MDDGSAIGYSVVAREHIAKHSLRRLDQLFDRSGAPRLTLVTRGGRFNEAGRSSRDNVVVTALPEAG